VNVKIVIGKAIAADAITTIMSIIDFTSENIHTCGFRSAHDKIVNIKSITHAKVPNAIETAPNVKSSV
jgi:hypothetical protein